MKKSRTKTISECKNLISVEEFDSRSLIDLKKIITKHNKLVQNNHSDSCFQLFNKVFILDLCLSTRCYELIDYLTEQNKQFALEILRKFIIRPLNFRNTKYSIYYEILVNNKFYKFYFLEDKLEKDIYSNTSSIPDNELIKLRDFYNEKKLLNFPNTIYKILDISEKQKDNNNFKVILYDVVPLFIDRNDYCAVNTRILEYFEEILCMKEYKSTNLIATSFVIPVLSQIKFSYIEFSKKLNMKSFNLLNNLFEQYCIILKLEQESNNTESIVSQDYSDLKYRTQYDKSYIEYYAAGEFGIYDELFLNYFYIKNIYSFDNIYFKSTLIQNMCKKYHEFELLYASEISDFYFSSYSYMALIFEYLKKCKLCNYEKWMEYMLFFESVLTSGEFSIDDISLVNIEIAERYPYTYGLDNVDELPTELQKIVRQYKDFWNNIEKSRKTNK